MILPDDLENLSDEALSCFCYDTPGFKTIYGRLTKETTREQLLRWIGQQINPPVIQNLATDPAPPITPPAAETPLPACPYRGLFAFRPENADIFFGRQRFTAQLVRAVNNRHRVTVLGASGSGKSSVVFAGLVPELAGHPAQQWRFTTFRPGDDPFLGLAGALVPLLYGPDLDIIDQISHTADWPPNCGRRCS